MTEPCPSARFECCVRHNPGHELRPMFQKGSPGDGVISQWKIAALKRRRKRITSKYRTQPSGKPVTKLGEGSGGKGGEWGAETARVPI